MKIKKLQIEGFGSHTDTTIDFHGKVNFILGALGSGKTTIAQAIEVALTGQCEHYRKRGDVVNDLISNAGDTERFMVEMFLDNDHYIKRSKHKRNSQALQWDESPGAAGEVEDRMLADLRMTKDKISALLNTTDFLTLEPHIQRALVLAIVGGHISTEAALELSPVDPAALQQYPVTLTDIDSIDTEYKRVYDERTDVTRTLKNTKVPAQPTAAAGSTIEEIQKALITLEDKERNLISERARLQGATQAIKPQRERLQKKHDELFAWFRQDQKPTQEALDKLSVELADRQKELEERRKKIEDIQTILDSSNRELAVHEEARNNLGNFTGSCIFLRNANQNCPVTASDIKRQIAGENKAIAEIQARVAATRDALKAAKALANDTSAVDRARQAIEQFKARADQWKQKVAEYNEVKAELEKLPKEDVDEEASKAAGLDKQISELRQRLEKGRNALDNARAWQTYNEQLAKVNEHRKELEIRKRFLNELVDWLGPKGVRSRIMAQRTAAFIEDLNKHFETFGLGKIDVNPDPWQITVNGLPVTRLSRSERFRFGVAIQIALAKAAQFHFIIIDNCEILSPDVRKQLVKTLLTSGLDQAIVISSLMIPEGEFKPPKIPDVAWYLVRKQNGASQVAEVL